MIRRFIQMISSLFKLETKVSSNVGESVDGSQKGKRSQKGGGIYWGLIAAVTRTFRKTQGKMYVLTDANIRTLSFILAKPKRVMPSTSP